MADLNSILELCGDLEMKLEETLLQKERRDLITEHLALISSKYKFTIPDFPVGCDWLNSVPLSLTNHLKGKVAVLDFFTYCCMNCLHVLPDLEILEETYSIEKGVVVIGVHSAKFNNEKVLDNVRNAVLRHNIMHPVINDPEAYLWNELMINCWPTFVVLGPNNEYLHSFAGEGNRQRILEFIDVALEYYGETGLIKPHQLPLHLEKNHLERCEDILQFPGKLCVDGQGSMLYISDSGHNRILGCDLTSGVIKTVIGGPEKGFQDGSFQNARFNNPQGLVLNHQTLYVADCDNHSVRKIDLTNNKVTTIAGTGFQGDDKEGGKLGTQQQLCSPYDLVMVPSVVSVSGKPDVLLIALAGSHQIWAYFLQDTVWFQKSQYECGTCVCVAGSGCEENRNNSYPLKASFAQPSGITYCPSQHCVYIADCESSSIRCFDLKSQAVRAVVGAERNPTNLFAYGDVDGSGIEAKLQHPLGVELLTDSPDGPLIVADTYNHKIKRVNLSSKSCSTLIGCGQPGDLISTDPLLSSFNEPADVAVDAAKQLIYIADTNNHRIKLFDLHTNSLSDFPLKIEKLQESVNVNSCDLDKTRFRITPKKTKAQLLETVRLCSSSCLTFQLDISFRSGVSLTNDMVSCWQIFTEDDASKQLLANLTKTNGDIVDLTNQPRIDIHIPVIDQCTPFQVHFECLLYTCSVKGLCNMVPLLYTQPIVISKDGLDCHTVTLKHSL
ncbi:NHL repeat-containing protein 2-like isoform X1 [Octopus sinensis]|uniref:NHL repeat-containing protein 2-like isoform X1 n=1 Tax=Octopus sinensis TaxID=2607531 RepID=A0A7E6F6K6_9MOLL|nr:NHL repeat-containing protein 2-like isoform X1 [Octopus sinensis]